MGSDYAFLIPGFLGLGKIGRFSYFEDGPHGLPAALRRVGVHVHPIIQPPPAASIHLRALTIAEEIMGVSAAWAPTTRIHLIGHSTGGLDAGELVWRPPPQFRPLRRKIASITTIATPHHGTPLADLLVWLGVDQLLEVIGMIGMSIPWSLPWHLTDWPIVREIRDLVVGITREVARQASPLLMVFADLATAVWDSGAGMLLYEYFDQMASNQGALRELAQGRKPYPVPDGVRCLSYAAGAEPAEDWLTPARALYRLFYALTAAGGYRPRHYPASPCRSTVCTSRDRRKCQPADGATVALNDGLVPIRSMMWGRCLGALKGDHLDLIGHPEILEPRDHPDANRIKQAHETIANAITPCGALAPQGFSYRKSL